MPAVFLGLSLTYVVEGPQAGALEVDSLPSSSNSLVIFLGI